MRSCYSRREWLLLFALSSVTFAGALVASLQAPFYPQEAEKKGATATEYGLVFGIFELAVFVSCPVFGTYMGRLGADLVLKCGILITGISSIAFGMLTYVEDRWWFIGLSFLVRIVEAFGSAAMVTAGLSIVVLSFTETFARVFTTLEIFQGLGYMVGPTVGGFLFELGGFICPFIVVGCFVLTMGGLIVCTLPEVKREDERRRKTALISVLKVVPVFLDALSMFIESTSLGFLLATLEPHLREFELTPSALGGIFVISGLVYTIVSPIIGYLCDKNFKPKKLILLGCAVTVGSFMFIGPVPFTTLQKSLTLVSIGLVLDGVGTSLIVVPAFVDAIYSAVKYGLPNDITTYALVSAIYVSSFALGAFVGPSAAGILFDTVGFRKATLFIFTIHIALFCSVSWFLCNEKKYDQRHVVVSYIKRPSQVADCTPRTDNLMITVTADVNEVLPLSPTTADGKRRNSSYKSISQESH